MQRQAVQHFLSAVYQALDLPPPHRYVHRLSYLFLLERRARLARLGIGRLMASSDPDDLDYTSEGDHILHQIADLSFTHRHARAGPPQPTRAGRV